MLSLVEINIENLTWAKSSRNVMYILREMLWIYK